MPIHITSRFDAVAGNGDEVEKLVSELASKTRNSKGALQYDFFRNDNEFLSVEIWENQESLDAHVAEESFKNANAKLAGMVTDKPAIRFWHKV